MSYSRFYTVWHDYPNTTTPALAAYYQALEDFLVTVTNLTISPNVTNGPVYYTGTGYASKLLVDAQVDPAAAIAYTKLALAASVVNGDISASAAIAYSKLNLAASVTNADIANAAAIAYSKLNLAGAVVNADIATSAAIALSKLADPGSGNVVTSAGSGAIAAKPPGYSFTYNEFTSPVSITNTTEALADTIATASAVTFDGATAVWIEFFCPDLDMSTSTAHEVKLWLYDGASSIGQIGEFFEAATGGQTAIPITVKRRLTPSNAAHTYSVRASIGGGTGSASATAGLGGTATVVPGFISITKAS